MEKLQNMKSRFIFGLFIFNKKEGLTGLWGSGRRGSSRFFLLKEYVVKGKEK